MIEVNYSGQEDTFSTVEEAITFSDNLSVGSDIWVNGELYRTRISDCFAGGFIVEVM